MKSVFAAEILNVADIKGFIDNFENEGKILVKGRRNTIKLFEKNGITYAVKSFRKPNIFNAVAYGLLRKSKARRSFEFAEQLLKLNIGTPKPIAYFEERSIFFGKSYYCSLFEKSDLLFKDLVAQPNLQNHELILRAFTRFTFDLHEKKVEFFDHTPGNTLINIQENGAISFLLVDLNRMAFNRPMSLDQRMKNMCRLTPSRPMIEIMAEEYARLCNRTYTEVFDKLWHYTCNFQRAFHRKKNLKRKLGLTSKKNE